MENALKMDDLGVALWPGKPPYVVSFNPNSQWNPIQPGLKKTASNVFIFRQKNYAKKNAFLSQGTSTCHMIITYFVDENRTKNNKYR